MADCPYGDRFAHTFTDLLAERPWDPDCKPRATDPCPLGFACPVHEPYVYAYATGTNPDTDRIAHSAR